MPIRWRLTFWYASLLAAALFVFGVGIFFVVRHALYDSFNEQLHSQAAIAMGAVQINGNVVGLEPVVIQTLKDDDHFVRMFNDEGTVQVDTSETIGQAPLEPSLVNDVLKGSTRLTWLDTKEGKFGVITAPIKSGDSIVGVLQVGLNRQDADDLVRILAIALAVAAPIALVFATVGGYLLAGRTLQPVSTITEMASTVSAADLHARLDLDLPNDEIGRLANTFNAMLARIDDAFQRQRRFTADAAHELRTPLSLLRSQVDLSLSRPRSTTEYQEALRGIDEDLERMTGLVATLLSLSRAENGKLPLEQTELDVGALERDVLSQYRPLAEAAQVSLVDESTPTMVEADEDLLIQVFVNLLDNALTHTPSGGRIALGCRQEDGAVRLWVEDNGSGIPLEHQPRIFDPFYRVDSGRSREHGGAGLGLAMCKAVAEAHQGKITVISRVGQGTKVELSMPIGT